MWSSYKIIIYMCVGVLERVVVQLKQNNSRLMLAKIGE